MLPQFERFLDFSGDAILINNVEWLRNLNYIDFLRDIGRHFSVNRMLSFETYKFRLESGLSFLEFNYQLLQAYDFLELNRRYGCSLQMGGDDQWANIISGTDLIRRVERKEAYGWTFPLLTTSSGEKMGKTEKGALWLDPRRTSAYEYYQYWVNTEDDDVGKFLALFTFLPMKEIRELGKLQGTDIREAKKRLAFETTALIHGKENSLQAQQSAQALFPATQGKEMETNQMYPAPKLLYKCRLMVAPCSTVVLDPAPLLLYKSTPPVCSKIGSSLVLLYPFLLPIVCSSALGLWWLCLPKQPSQ